MSKGTSDTSCMTLQLHNDQLEVVHSLLEDGFLLHVIKSVLWNVWEDNILLNCDPHCTIAIPVITGSNMVDRKHWTGACLCAGEGTIQKQPESAQF